MKHLSIFFVAIYFLLASPLTTAAQEAPEPQLVPTHSVALPMVVGTGGAQVSYANETLSLMNAARANAGCGPLVISDTLTTIAQQHAQDMASNDFFSHVNLQGLDAGDRADQAGYPWLKIAENIGGGQSSAQEIYTSWMNSSSHRANIENCSLKETGIGYVYVQNDQGSQTWSHYWVEVFGTR